MLHAHAPSLRPHLLEDFQKPGSRERDPVFADVSQRIVAVRLGRVGRVQVNHVVGPVSRHIASDALDQVAVGVDDGNAGTAGDVLERHGFKERRFPGARFADHVNMRHAIFGLDSEDAVIAAEIGARKKDTIG